MGYLLPTAMQTNDNRSVRLLEEFELPKEYFQASALIKYLLFVYALFFEKERQM